MSTQYKNTNQFPVVVPSKRGGSFTILPGESQSDPWFSRFCGRKQLTRFENNVSENYAPGKKPSDVPSTIFQDLVGDIQQESRYYRRVSDIYQCKLCDEFRTGSKEALKRHLKTTHLMDVKDVDYIGEPKVEAPVVTPAKAPDADPETEKNIEVAAEEIADVASKVVEAVKTLKEPVVETFECDICNRTFKSAPGLKAHKTMKHKDSNG